MHEIKVPRESANDNEVLIVSFSCHDGDWVQENSVVASVEGEKAVYDIVSPASGHIYYVAKIHEKRGIDNIIAVIVEEPLDNVAKIQERYNLPQQLAIEPAVKFYGNSQRKSNFRMSSTSVQRIAVIGAGRGLDQILDAAMDNRSIKITAAYDDVKFESILGYSGVPVVGRVDFEKIIIDYEDGLFDALLISVSTNIKFRKTCFNILSPSIPFANLIHKTVSLSPNSSIGQGNIILANAVIGRDARVGNNNFISAMCNIEHHCRVGDHCTFGPGVIFSGGVEVCNEVKFGTGIFVEPFYSIKTKMFVKSGSILKVGGSDGV